jgi:hypothetical protein
VTLFGSYQKRNFSFDQPGEQLLEHADADGLPRSVEGLRATRRATTVINNAPTDPNSSSRSPTIIATTSPRASRERINGQAVIQFKPTDSLTLTVDGLYAQLQRVRAAVEPVELVQPPVRRSDLRRCPNGIATTNISTRRSPA